MATLPTINVPDAELPRLAAALRARMNDYVSTPAQVYKAFVIATLRALVKDYERDAAETSARQSVSASADVNLS